MLALFRSAPSMCWLVIFIAFLVIEGMTTTLFCLWFAVGALAALLVSLLTVNLWVQSFTFAILSLVTILFVRPLAKKILTPKPAATNADRLIGHTAVVTEPIDEIAGTGLVKVSGLVWSARSPDGRTIPKDSQVTILSIEGVKLMVKPVEAEVSTS